LQFYGVVDTAPGGWNYQAAVWGSGYDWITFHVTPHTGDNASGSGGATESTGAAIAGEGEPV
jgi:hypothetical protein